MSIVIGILTVLEVIVCLLLSLLVLMQRPRQEGLGATFGSGMTDQMFGAQTTNVLQKGTVYFGIALFALTFLLAVLTAKMDEHNKPSNARLVDSADLKPKATATTPAASTPSAPASANKDATPAAAPAKTEPAKTEDKKPAEAKPEATKPAAPKPAETKPTPAPAAAAPAPAPAANTKPAESTPPAPAAAPKPEEKK